MARKPKTKDIDIGEKRVRKDMKKINKSFVTIGIHASASPYKLELGTIPVYVVAACHEFGTQKIPERSFMRSTVDREREKWWKLIEKLIDSITKGKVKPEDALNIVGIEVMEAIHETINNFLKYFPQKDISPARIKQKKREFAARRPLVATYHMRDSILYKVTIKK